MKWLLDTCVISELISRQPNQRVVNWIDGIQPDWLYLSVITIGEIRKGIEKLAESKRRDTIHRWLTEDLLLRFKGRVVPLDIDAMITWGTLTGRLEKTGRVISAIDSLIAATALQGDFVLTTRNVNDFAGAGVTIYNPWEE